MSEQLFNLEADKPHEACGVFGVYAPGADVVSLAYLGAEALQHRGQDAAGFMVAIDSEGMLGVKDTGLVSEVITNNVIEGFGGAGRIAISHTRYGTTEGAGPESSQPIFVFDNGRPFALAHNGHIELSFKHAYSTDSEWFAHEIADTWQEGEEIEEAIERVAKRTDGAYSIVIMTDDKLIGLRDRNGFRPLELGVLKENQGYVIASETAAIEQVDATHDREVQPGEIVVIDSCGVKSDQFAESDPKLCAFEYIYFARPSSEISGQGINEARKNMGKMLADQNQHKLDLVIGVPDSGMPAALGFAEASGVPYDVGLEKNRYITRTFIKNNQVLRENAVRLKLTPLQEVISGKRIAVVDDSIVRGTTTRALASMLYEAGAAEVHLKIASPPYRWPCFYGMDTGDPTELLANRKDHTGMEEEIGVHSLDFLTIDHLQQSVGLPMGKLCMACLDGNYPIEVPVQFNI